MAGGATFCIFIRTFLCVGSFPYFAKSCCSCGVKFCEGKEVSSRELV